MSDSSFTITISHIPEINKATKKSINELLDNQLAECSIHILNQNPPPVSPYLLKGNNG